MTMQQNSRKSLRCLLAASGTGPNRFLFDGTTRVDLQAPPEIAARRGTLDHMRDRSVLLALDSQLDCAVALIELDGIARRVVICPPDLPPNHISSVLDGCEVDTVICDRMLPEYSGRNILHPSKLTESQTIRHDGCRLTEWTLFTSGTTGQPKTVVHSLESLSGHLPAGSPSGTVPVWSTFYDIRRYGGLQMLLRALVGGGSLVLSNPHESPGAFLSRAGACGVTHILGTPSHWRRALMTGEAGKISPVYIRLSGEVADQTILDRLREMYPHATIAHAFASTEAGVAFEVQDGQSGFPANLVDSVGSETELRVIDSSLRIRSPRLAKRYLSGSTSGLMDEHGFIDTGDIVELRGDRYYFVGRKEGVINIGAQKVHPEEVEAVINRHPGVELSFVKSRRSPITGAIIAAEVVMKSQVVPACRGSLPTQAAGLTNLIEEILVMCRAALPAHKVPATIRIVPALDIAPSGKLARPRA